MADSFALPRGVTGFGVDTPASEEEARRSAFLAWARSVAAAAGSTLSELPLAEPRPSFDSVHIERLGVWLLHNRYSPLVGALHASPEPGTSWAVRGEFVDLVVPRHATGWGPEVLAANVLNADLAHDAIGHLGQGANEQADRYKPETVGHVLFNYWS